CRPDRRRPRTRTARTPPGSPPARARPAGCASPHLAPSRADGRPRHSTKRQAAGGNAGRQPRARRNASATRTVVAGGGDGSAHRKGRRMAFGYRKTRMPTTEEALPGRTEPMPVPARHTVLGNPLTPPFPDGLEQAVFGMGCFWGAERTFWRTPGVWTTAVGYAGGLTPNPTYEEVCGGRTGHAEVVLIVF